MVKPLGDHVLVKPTEPLRQTEGGVIIPEVIQEKPRMGVVLAVGPGMVSIDNGVRTKPDVEPGETVLFSQYAGVNIEVGGVRYLMLRDGDLLGVVLLEDLESPFAEAPLEEIGAPS